MIVLTISQHEESLTLWFTINRASRDGVCSSWKAKDKPTDRGSTELWARECYCGEIFKVCLLEKTNSMDRGFMLNRLVSTKENLAALLCIYLFERD